MKNTNLTGPLALTLLLIGAPLLLAQVENNWTGNGSAAIWSDDGNWDLPPLTDKDVVVFPAGSTNKLVNTNDTALTFDGITVNSDAVQVWGNALTLNTNAPIRAEAQSLQEWNFNNDSLNSDQGLNAQFFGGDGNVLADTNGNDQYTVIRGDGFSGYRPFGWAANAGTAEKLIVSVTLSEFDISTTDELRFDIRLKSGGVDTNIALLSFDGQSTNDVNNTSGFNRVRLTGSAGSTNPVATVPVGIALNTNASTTPITYGLTLDFTDNSYTYWIGTPDSDGGTWVSRFASHTGTNGVDLSTASIDGVQWGIQQAGGSGTVAPGDTFTLDQVQIYAVLAGGGPTVHNDITYPDPVDATANWQVTGVNGLLTLGGTITALQQGASTNIAPQGYAMKTGTGTLRLTGSGSQINYGVNVKGGTLELDGAGLTVNSDLLRISHNNDQDASLTLKNGASLLLTNLAGNNISFDVGSFSQATLNTNYLNVEGGTLTIAHPGRLRLSRDIDDAAVVTQNGGLVDLTRNNGPGLEFMPSSPGGGSGVYDLNGGTLRLRNIKKQNAGMAVFNFNGGTLEHGLSGGNAWDISLLDGIDDVNILAGHAIIDTAGNDATITNVVDGVGGLIKRGSGQLRFLSNSYTTGRANTFSGPVIVEGGTLKIHNVDSLGAAFKTVTVGTNAVLWSQNNGGGDGAALFYNLVFEGGATFQTGGGGGRPAADTVFNGVVTYDIGTFTTHYGPITNGTPDAALIKKGSGTLQLNGVNQFTGNSDNTFTLPGASVVEAGVLRMAGASNTLGSLTVKDGAQFQAFGRFDGPVTIEGGGEWGPGFNLNSGQIAVVNNNSSFTIQTNSGVGFLAGSYFQLDPDGYTNATVENPDPLRSDRIADLQSMAYGGDLIVGDVSTSYAAGQRFQLFSAANYSGAFANIFLPALADPNLAWSTDFLNVDGTLRIIYSGVAAPAPESLVTTVQGGTNLVVSWTDPKWWLEVQTNPVDVGLSNNWSYLPGSSPVSIPISTNVGTLFLRLAFESQ